MEEFELPDKPESHKERIVGLIIASIAVVLAIVTALGHQVHNEEILAHVDASDQFAFYQAKKERILAYQLSTDSIRLGGARPEAQPLLDGYAAQQKRLEEDAKGIQEEGKRHLAEAAQLAVKAEVLDLGEIALQISVVLCSITILTEQRLFVAMGVTTAGIGVAISLWGLVFYH